MGLGIVYGTKKDESKFVYRHKRRQIYILRKSSHEKFFNTIDPGTLFRFRRGQMRICGFIDSKKGDEFSFKIIFPAAVVVVVVEGEIVMFVGMKFKSTP